MADEEKVYVEMNTEMDAEEAALDKMYRDCLRYCNHLTEACRDFIYVANTGHHDGLLATKMYNDDKTLLDIYDRIHNIAEDLDRIKKWAITRKHNFERKNEEES